MNPFGVYIHFPYCLKKCPYCDFVSFAKERADIDHKGYADTLLAELSMRAKAFESRQLSSIFFGGGTPSLWEPEELGRVLARVLEMAGSNKSECIEITVECNPSSLDEARARALKDVGVNRLSVGIQGLEEKRLAFLGRLHDREGGLGALRSAIAAKIPRVSGDFIYAVAGGLEQTPEAAAEEARVIANTGVGHVSAYNLTIEAGTEFGELSRRGRLPMASDDAMADSFFAIDEALSQLGFIHYEISNYSLPGEMSRHNLGYWRGDDYLGLGCAAFGTLSDSRTGQARRYRNATVPERYAELVRKGRVPSATEEELSPLTRLRERIMLGLRLADGFDLEAAALELGLCAWTESRKKEAERLQKAGQLERFENKIRISRRAWIFADGIAADLF